MENSKTLYQRLVENVPVGAYRVADSGELRYANDTLAQIVGYDTAAQLDAAETGIEYTNPRDRESFRERLDTLSAPFEGDDIRTLLRNRTAAGNSRDAV